MEFTLNINLNKNLPVDDAREKLADTTGKEPGETINDSSEKIKSPAAHPVKIGVASAQILSELKNIGATLGNSVVSTYGLRHGDEAAQAKLNNIVNVSSEIAGATATTLSAVTTAKALGASGPVGAVIGLALITLQKAVESYSKVIEYRDMDMARNAQEIRSSERLGIIATDRNRGR